MNQTLKVMDLSVCIRYRKRGFCVLVTVLLLVDDMMYLGDSEEFLISITLILSVVRKQKRILLIQCLWSTGSSAEKIMVSYLA